MATNQQILVLYDIILGFEESDKKFPYKLSSSLLKNKELITPVLNNFRKIQTPNPRFNEFELRRIELNKNFSKKDTNGEPLIQDRAFVIEDSQGFDVAFKALQEEYADVLRERTAKQREIEEFLDMESGIELFKVSEDIIGTLEFTVRETSAISIIVE